MLGLYNAPGNQLGKASVEQRQASKRASEQDACEPKLSLAASLPARACQPAAAQAQAAAFLVPGEPVGDQLQLVHKEQRKT